MNDEEEEKRGGPCRLAPGEGELEASVFSEIVSQCRNKSVHCGLLEFIDTR